MHNSIYWLNYFTRNLKSKRIDWSTNAALTQKEKRTILKSLQAWQLGETSEGVNLISAAKKYAQQFNDSHYTDSIRLFIKEEQKHGNNLGRYIDLIGEQRINKNWGDSLFRRIRGLNTNMEFWTIAVITVECCAQLFYQCLKDATQCRLLKQICTDILIDEAAHITFQIERLSIIYGHKNAYLKFVSYHFYSIFYFSTAMVVWFAHKKVFKAGGINFFAYCIRMKLKFKKSIRKLRPENNNLIMNRSVQNI